MADDAPAGVPEWIVTYGDMMSLLLTFFIMLVSLSEVKGDAKYQAIVQSIMKYMGYNAAPLAPAGEGFPLNAIIERLKKLGGHSNTHRGTGGVKTPGPKGDDLRVFRGRDGTAITAGNLLSFSPGSDELSAATIQTLHGIAQQLAGKPNKIDIRGHSAAGSLPANCPFPDGITLSYARARAVSQVLVESHIPRERIRISATVDSEPANASQQLEVPPDRVEVFVLDAYAKDFIGPRDVAN